MSDSRAEAFDKWFDPDDGKNYRDCWNAACEWQASRAQPERKLTDYDIEDLVEILWMRRTKLHGGELMPQLVDFARALLAAQPAPIDSIRAILKGIDQEENERGDGWWETQAQAEFGADKLRQIEALFNAPREAQTAAATVPDKSMGNQREIGAKMPSGAVVTNVFEAFNEGLKAAAMAQAAGVNMHTQSTHPENVLKNDSISYACDRTGMLMPFRCGDCLCWSQPSLKAAQSGRG